MTRPDDELTELVDYIVGVCDAAVGLDCCAEIRDRIAAYAEKRVEKEREACARLCFSTGPNPTSDDSAEWCAGRYDARRIIAAAIRARGKPSECACAETSARNCPVPEHRGEGGDGE